VLGLSSLKVDTSTDPVVPAFGVEGVELLLSPLLVLVAPVALCSLGLTLPPSLRSILAFLTAFSMMEAAPPSAFVPSPAELEPLPLELLLSELPLPDPSAPEPLTLSELELSELELSELELSELEPVPVVPLVLEPVVDFVVLVELLSLVLGFGRVFLTVVVVAAVAVVATGATAVDAGVGAVGMTVVVV
jgi:hypothetical protein